jgi:ribose-phosphate pyrophosphokinase
MSTIVLIGQKTNPLVTHLAQKHTAATLYFTVTQFADTELFVAFDDISNGIDHIKNARVFIAYQFPTRLVPTLSINDHLVVLTRIIDIVKNFSPESITLVVPYLPYSRQDRSTYSPFLGGIFTLGRILNAIGVEQVITCDLHAPIVAENFPMPITHISLDNFWVSVLKEQFDAQAMQKDFCIVSPDKGGFSRAQAVATALQIPVAVAHKKRVGTDNTISFALDGSVAGKNVIIIDDIIDTGGTALGALDVVIKNGANDVYACFSHAVLAKNALEKLDKSVCKKIMVTNTLENVAAAQKQSGKISVHDVNAFLTEHI